MQHNTNAVCTESMIHRVTGRNDRENNQAARTMSIRKTFEVFSTSD